MIEASLSLGGSTVGGVNQGTFSVAELCSLIRTVIEQTMPDDVWVEGEISGLHRARNGHVYFDLVEPGEGPGAAPVATMPVVLFRESRDRVNRLLKRHGDPIRMSDGVCVRIQGRVDYYPPSARVQLRMSSIDPTYTLGKLAASKDALLAELSAEGILRANAAQLLEPVPLRVGLVTSIGSAAHADISTVFEQAGMAFTVVEVDTPVQGSGAEVPVAAAIRAAEDADADVVLVARGGGSKTDLAVFDHEVVARAIASVGVPVVTGIGHDIDRSVADEVAHTATTTPTAAAQFVVGRVQQWLDRLGDHERSLVAAGRRAVQRADQRVETVRSGVAVLTANALDRSDRLLAARCSRLVRTARSSQRRAVGQIAQAVARLEVAQRHGLTTAERRVDAVAAQVRALNPALALARGWSITRDGDGRVVRSAASVESGDIVTTQLADGDLTSTITAATHHTRPNKTRGSNEPQDATEETT
ncbi:MAG: exodeoxyribonuclease VII large subunit [Acidimicrobiaceae bacterium]|nr:exodeoxyribonuclease VII large subunit [Acidimicrobiaceae bacterium]MXW75885.1 exodeoxyribonuclease VII large subunit [Acidimicrobiaceae bacterium]MYA73725.1 exodeoxyribonuclease VII large subunit [Acidimicrobiaceae bacterium]MYC43006.1 exodeoxyribonuclease VII large subunit [Acidimicrobiaceae bacterium]MYD07300.1 exodeoxyribonuclease VII large subunit [Acidimicrobiaceae bacterium]